MTNDEFYAKLKTLPKEELESYAAVASNIKKFIDFAAVSLILMVLIFTNIFTVIMGGLVVFTMGRMSVNVTNTLDHIRKLLSRMP